MKNQSFLEYEPERSLHLAHVSGRALVRAKASCNGICCERVLEARQVGMIQNIENFPSYLEALAFCHSERLRG